MRKSPSDIIYSSYASLLDSSNPGYKEYPGEEYPIPSFPKEILKSLFQQSMVSLMSVPMLARVNFPAVIIGDIHGNIRDLLRLIRVNGSPSSVNYVLLGDFVDRGEFSLEVITLILALQVKFPHNITVVRGNHECTEICSTYGFKNDIMSKFGDIEMFDMAMDAFDNLSLAAVLGNEYLCVHGGICSGISCLKDISNLRKPLNFQSASSKNVLIAEGILWSDPHESYSLFSESTRGRGELFGMLAVLNFLKGNQLKGIIRGHSFIRNGVEASMSNLVYTVFSSGCYNGTKPQNRPGYLVVTEQGVQEHFLQPIPQMVRSSTHFVKYVNATSLGGLVSGLNLHGLTFFSSPRQTVNNTAAVPRARPPVRLPAYSNKIAFARVGVARRRAAASYRSLQDL